MNEQEEFDCEPTCSICGGELEYEDCPDCHDSGIVWSAGDAEDPYTGYKTCETCDGSGGEWYCPHPHEVGWSV